MGHDHLPEGVSEPARLEIFLDFGDILKATREVGLAILIKTGGPPGAA